MKFEQMIQDGGEVRKTCVEVKVKKGKMIRETRD